MKKRNNNIVIRLYRPTGDESRAIQIESEGLLQRLPDQLLAAEIRKYHTNYLPYIKNEKKATSHNLGEGNVGRAKLYKPENEPPFVQKTFKGQDTEFRYGQYSVRDMNFMIDARVMRVLGQTSIGPIFQGSSYAAKEIITSFCRGARVSSSTAVPEIPYQQIKNMVDGMIEMHRLGVTIDNNPSNILYNTNDGFSVIDALPSSRLISVPSADLEYCRMKIFDCLGTLDDWEADKEVTLHLIDTNFDISMAEHLFSAAKFITYAAVKDLGRYAKKVSADKFLHNINFQQVFLTYLLQVLGIVKIHYRDLFPSFFNYVKEHLERLKMACAIQDSWVGVQHTYYEVAASDAIASDPQIAANIARIKALL